MNMFDTFFFFGCFLYFLAFYQILILKSNQWWLLQTEKEKWIAFLGVCIMSLIALCDTIFN